MDNKVEHCEVASPSPTTQQKESTSAEDELSTQLAASSIDDSDQLQSDTEILRKVISFFKKTLQTSKKEVRPLEVAKACIGQNASKGHINNYLHHLRGAGVLSVTFKKDFKSDPYWSALPKIKDITDERIRELAKEIKSRPKTGTKSGKKSLDQPSVTNTVTPGKTESSASKTAGSEVKTCSVPSMPAPAYPFSKGTQNQKDVFPSIVRAEVSKSVGLIHIEGQPVGTGFRVGEKYLVTCGHVIQSVIKVKPHMLDGERLTIEFYRITYNQKDDPHLIFGFQSWIAYFDEDHDFVVLELRSLHDNYAQFPPPLTCFADVFNSEIHLVGHPGGRQMKEDNVVPRWSPDHDEEIIPYIEGLAHWSKSYFPDQKDYYSVLLEPPRKIMFHTTFDTGSSGSPGVMIRNNKPCVVVMVRGGTPSCFYDNLFPQSPVIDDYKVEYGYAMSDIYLKMSKCTQQKIRDLAAEIFGEWI